MVVSPLTVKLSIIIPSVGRENALFQTVAALLPQLLPDEEIIVVDQNQPALTWPENLGQDTRLHIVHRRNPGLTRARNAGLKQARHPFAVFLDDDIQPDPILLGEFRRVALQAPEKVWTGCITQADQPTSIAPAPSLPEADFGPVGFVDRSSGEIVTDYSNPTNGTVPFFAGGLCLLPIHRLGRGRLFSPSFRGAAQGEEIDLALRLRQQGIAIESDARIHIKHLKIPYGGCRSRENEIQFAEDEIFNRGFFWGRHGHRLGWRAFYRRSRAFIEFHSRRTSASRSHSPWRIFNLGRHWLHGLVLGIWKRGRTSG